MAHVRVITCMHVICVCMWPYKACLFDQSYIMYTLLSSSLRYAFGIIICCLALLTMALTVVGIALGVLGWRKDRSPNSRTKVSHCGGIILLM